MPADKDDQALPEPASSDDGDSNGDYDANLLPKRIRDVIESLPAEERANFVQGLSLTITATQRRTAPVPPPAEVEEYERIRPGSADDFMLMAKNEQHIKEKAITGQLQNERLRIFVGLLGVIGLTGATAFAIWHGATIPAAITAISAVIVAVLRSGGGRSKD